MAYDIGTARGVIEIGYDGKGAKQAQADLASVDKKGQGVSASMEKTGRMAGGAGLVIAAGLAVGVNAAANFEQRLSAIQAVSGATEAEMGKLSDKALQLGADTSFSAGESATAMEELIKAGLSVDDVLNGAADATVALAAAGEVALPEAATIASNAMNQFGLKAEDMVGVVDSIAGAANSSAIDVSDFGQSLSQVGAVANLAGVDFDDTATAIALMGNAGIKGSDAGTSLKSMFMRLQPTTKKQTKLFKELGLITKDGSNQFYDAQGNLKGLSDVSGILQTSLKGMTKEQKQATLQTLFGSDAIRGAAILANEGSKGFDKMANSMAKTSAADVAKTRLDNFKGSLEALMGSLETLGITLGTILLPFIRTVVEQLTQLVNWFTNLSPAVQTSIVAFLAIIAAGLLLFAAFIKIAKGINTIATALKLVRVAMATTWIAALGPIALVIAAIVAIVAVFVILWKKSETFRNFWKSIWAAIKSAAKAVADWFNGTIVPSFGKAWDQLQTGLSFLKGIWITIWNGIKTYFSGVWDLIVGIIKTAMSLLQGDLSGALDGIKQAFKGAWNVLTAGVRTAWELMRQIAGDKINALMDRVEQIPGDVKGAIGDLGGILLDAGRDLIQGLIDGIQEKFADVQSMLSSLTSKLPDWKGPKSKDQRLLTPTGIWIMEGLADGLAKGAEKVRIRLAEITNGLFNGLPRDLGPIESDVAADVDTLMQRIEEEYLDKAEKAQKRIEKRYRQKRKALEKALKESEQSATKEDDKANQKALDKLDKQQERAIKRAQQRYRNLTKEAKKAIHEITAALTENARKQDEVNEKLTVAAEQLQTLQDQAQSFRDGVVASFTDFANVVGLGIRTVGEETTVTLDDLLVDLRKRVTDAARFAALIAQLAASGLNDTTINQLLAAGVEGGLATAEAIAAGGQAGIDEINSLTGQLVASGVTLATQLSDQFYGAGIAAAQSVVDGLVLDAAALVVAGDKLEADLVAALGGKANEGGKKAGRAAIDGLHHGLVDDEDRVTNAGRRVARKLIQAFREEMGIHSPSKIMLNFGQMLGLGLARGIEGSERMVEKAATGVGMAAVSAIRDRDLVAAVGATASPLALSAAYAPATLPIGASPTGGVANGATGLPSLEVTVLIGNEEFKGYIQGQVGETLAPLQQITRQGGL